MGWARFELDEGGIRAAYSAHAGEMFGFAVRSLNDRGLAEEDGEDRADHRVAHVPVRAGDDETRRGIPRSEGSAPDPGEERDRPADEREPESDQHEPGQCERPGAEVGAGAPDDDSRHGNGDREGQQPHREEMAPDTH